MISVTYFFQMFGSYGRVLVSNWHFFSLTQMWNFTVEGVKFKD